MNKKNIELAIYISAVLVALGVFLPLTKLPVYGDVNYNKIAALESYLVILCALSAPALLIMGQAKKVLLSAAGVWVVLLFPAIKSLFAEKDDSFLGKMTDQATSVMTDFASELFLNVDTFSWGGFVFLIALLLLTLAAVMRSLQK